MSALKTASEMKGAGKKTAEPLNVEGLFLFGSMSAIMSSFLVHIVILFQVGVEYEAYFVIVTLSALMHVDFTPRLKKQTTLFELTIRVPPEFFGL